MQIFTFTATLGALATGIIAAVYWLLASNVPIDPGWPKWPNGVSIAPGDAELTQMGWTAAIMENVRQSGRLNAIAARWTAASVFLGALPGIAGSVAGWLGIQ